MERLMWRSPTERLFHRRGPVTAKNTPWDECECVEWHMYWRLTIEVDVDRRQWRADSHRPGTVGLNRVGFLKTNMASLSSTRWRTGSQWSCRRIGVMWSRRRVQSQTCRGVLDWESVAQCVHLDAGCVGVQGSNALAEVCTLLSAVLVFFLQLLPTNDLVLFFFWLCVCVCVCVCADHVHGEERWRGFCWLFLREGRRLSKPQRRQVYRLLYWFVCQSVNSRSVMSHSPPTYVLEFSHARIHQCHAAAWLPCHAAAWADTEEPDSSVWYNFINAMRIEHTYTATYNWQFIEQSSVT